MQLKIRRSQRQGGAFGGKVYFCVNARAEYSPEEQANILKYHLEGEILYSSAAAEQHRENAAGHFSAGSKRGVGFKGWLVALVKGIWSAIMMKFSLVITIRSLERGQQIECKDLGELMGAEEAIHEACKNVKNYLQIAQSFDGREQIYDFSGTPA